MEKLNSIRNCEIKFRLECPQLWDALKATDQPKVRFCDSCQKNVFLCVTDVETLDHARQGHCVARAIAHVGGIEKFRVGMPGTAQTKHTEEETAALANAGMENRKTQALRDLPLASRDCPQCGYPVVNWVSHCRVCGKELGKIKPNP